jgi:hypothetical protein
MALKGMGQVVIVHFERLLPMELKKNFEGHNKTLIYNYYYMLLDFGFTFFSS